MAIKQKIQPMDSDEHAHEGGGALGMTVGGVAGGIAGGVGAVAAASAAGAVAGSAVGPAGAIIGAAIGGAIGGITGEAIARQINPTDEEKYWENAYRSRPYYSNQYDYEAYRPAYRTGVNSFISNPTANFDSIEPDLSRSWNQQRGTSTLDWNQARPAAQDAHTRLKDKYAK